MTIRERYQSSVLGDTINLDLFVYQNNLPENLYDIQKVEIYFKDKSQIDSINTEGRMIKAVYNESAIYSVTDGQYRLELYLDDNLYEVGDYIDVWYVKYNSYESEFSKIENNFKIHTDLWQKIDVPFIYDITFSMKPHKISFGSKKYINIGFYPNIIDENILKKFYFNIKDTNNLYIRIEQIEGCGYDSEYELQNIKTVPEWSSVEFRQDNIGHYLLDVTQNGKYDIGIYQVQFKAILGEIEIVSPKFHLQIYD